MYTNLPPSKVVFLCILFTEPQTNGLPGLRYDYACHVVKWSCPSKRHQKTHASMWLDDNEHPVCYYILVVIAEHMYECRAPDEEAEDLFCTACYPDGDNGHYNCSCWAPRQPEPPEVVYLTCQDALDKGENESGVYVLKPDHLPAFQVINLK